MWNIFANVMYWPCRCSWYGWVSTPFCSCTSTWHFWWSAGSTPECCWGWVSIAVGWGWGDGAVEGDFFHLFFCSSESPQQHLYVHLTVTFKAQRKIQILNCRRPRWWVKSNSNASKARNESCRVLLSHENLAMPPTPPSPLPQKKVLSNGPLIFGRVNRSFSGRIYCLYLGLDVLVVQVLCHSGNRKWIGWRVSMV